MSIIKKSDNYIDGRPAFVPEKEDPAYVHERLKKFIDLFEKSKEQHRNTERIFVYFTIVISAFISVVNVFSVFDSRETQILISIISAILDAAVTITVGILQHEIIIKDVLLLS